MAKHPILPDHRPLAIAHRAGNDIPAALRAIERGVDMIETDVWPFWNQLQIRHAKSIGPLPIYWEKWYIESFFGKQLQLHELVGALPLNTPLFLDLKGIKPRLGEMVVSAIEDLGPNRQVIVCGRAWQQLDPIESLPNVHVFYSVGDEAQLALVWGKLEQQRNPAISINYGLLTAEVMQRLNDLGTTVIAWTVNDPTIAHTLFDLGVDGFTSDNNELLDRIISLRHLAFDEYAEAALPTEPEPEGEPT